MSYYESKYVCYSATYNSPYCHHFRVRSVSSLNHLLLRLISSFRRIEISKQTNAKADDSNLSFLLIRIAIGKTNKFDSGVKRIWSAYISRAATPYALTGAILLLLAASTLSCWMSPLARIALPQTTWPPRVPPECPC